MTDTFAAQAARHSDADRSDRDSGVDVDDEFDRRHRSLVRHAVKFGRVTLLLFLLWVTTGTTWLIWLAAFLAFGLARRAQAAADVDPDGTPRRSKGGCCFR